MRTVSTVLALVLFGPASGADPVPTFKVENKTFVVVNKIAPTEKPQTVPGVAPRPGEPARTPGVVIQRPFHGSYVGHDCPGQVWNGREYARCGTVVTAISGYGPSGSHSHGPCPRCGSVWWHR